MALFGFNKIDSLLPSSTGNIEKITNDPYWISWKNSSELTERSSANKVSLVWISFFNNTGSERDYPYGTSTRHSLERKD